MALAGILSDAIPRRRPLFLSAIVFQLVGIAMVTISTSLAFWIAGVAVAGCSSGFVWASSLAIVLDSTSEKRIAQSMSYVGLSISCGIMLGPFLGGIVYHVGGHYAVWGMCFGLITADVTLRIVMIEPKGSRILSVTDRNYCEGERSCEEGHHNEGEIACRTSTLNLTPTLRTSSLQHDDCSKRYPALLTLWKSPRFSFAIFATICLAVAATSFDGTLPIYVEGLFGFSSISTGLLYLALTVPAFSQPLIGYLVDRHGGRIIGTLGFALSVPAFVCLRFVDHNSLSQKVLLVALLVIIGTCLAATLSVYMAEVSRVVFEHKKADSGLCGEKGSFAQAHCLWSAAYSIGCTLGPIWGGEIQKVAGWRTETWTVALFCGGVAVLAPVFTGQRYPTTWRNGGDVEKESKTDRRVERSSAH
ncbi:hypothetical protein H2198_003945 [Neophaeococcomyces mojaviensis]|uniref:Uncharacterized protein n=1 Tax=Neophaeococcomyces mojaviensis TaxID=3383035 RepID=A0ACC3AA26_9EURO|nr:hypothetical protein H2198_003945 [Knufia sp. JES_112]